MDRLQRYSTTPEASALLKNLDRPTSLIPLPDLTSAERSKIDPEFLDGSGRVAATMLGGAWLDLGEYVVHAGETLMSALGFKAALRYSLVRSDRQRDERADIGIDLSFLEDYLDGACFHPNNTKIMEQSRHSLVRQVETEVYRRRMGEKISHSLRRMMQKRWHTYINTSVQASVGNLLYTLATTYATHSLAVEDVLWRDDQGRRLLRRQLTDEFSDVEEPQQKADQLIEELDRGTMRILNKIFHASAPEAERVVRREYAYSVEQSIQRRVRYDHQYAIGELPAGPEEDLQRIGAEPRTVDQIRVLIKHASEEIGRFRLLLDGNDFSNHWRRYTPEMKRALEVAYFTNEANFRAIIAGNAGGNNAAIREHADFLAERFTAEASEKLRRLRLHHQLALFEYVDTMRQLIELAYSDTAFVADAETAPETKGKNA